jgi:hypothetical protein
VKYLKRLQESKSKFTEFIQRNFLFHRFVEHQTPIELYLFSEDNCTKRLQPLFNILELKLTLKKNDAVDAYHHELHPHGPDAVVGVGGDKPTEPTAFAKTNKGAGGAVGLSPPTPTTASGPCG